MHYRRTIGSEVEVGGVGVHSGDRVHVRLLPAEPRSGVVFVRVDHGGVEIPARLEHTGPSAYATVLERDGLTLSTIEHLMAALYALQIDDVRVEVDGPEIPILDGSAKPWVLAVRDAGNRESTVPREYLTVVRPVVVSEEEKRVSVYPAADYRVTYAVDFDHPVLGYQELTASLWAADQFAEKLAPARTFVRKREAEALRKAGKALGGSLSNAIVIDDEGILNTELRFPDEFVRHKMLDLTGDLSLVGYPVRGHVVAYRAGHHMHARFARALWEARDSWHLATWTESDALSRAQPGV